MNRNLKDVYLFISDDSKMFYRADQDIRGDYIITKSAQPYPIKYNPRNLKSSPVEFATNNKYFSLNRSISYPLDFIKDGAAILRSFYFLGKGVEQHCFLTILQWNGDTGVYELSYNGKFDFSQKKEDPKSGVFTVSTIDDSAWGVLSQNDGVEYAIDCSATNPKAIKVLFDGITLLNKYTYQTVQAPIIDYTAEAYHTIPFVLINQDGDSSGIITKDQSTAVFGTGPLGVPLMEGTWFFGTAFAITGVNISGSFTFEWSTNVTISGGLVIYFVTSTGQEFMVFNHSRADLIRGKIYTTDFDFTFNLAVDEKIWFIAKMTDNPANLFQITPITTDVFLTTKTIQEPVVAYGLRPLDLLQQIVAKATYGRYSINSEYFTANNNSILLSGDSIRGIPFAKIYSSFEDFFKTFDALNFMALRVINGTLWMELATEVYKNSGTIIDIGECIDCNLAPATEHFGNEIEVGSPKQDYRHPSGRLEFNSTNTFSLPFTTIKKKLSYVTKYRTGCYDIQFLLLDYKGQSSVDNSGDKNVYVADISDTLGTAVEDIQTFENVNIDNVPLEPIIKTPLNTDVITNANPRVTGIAPAGSNVSIYVDNVLDGSTTADADSNWEYDIVTPLDTYEEGVHTGIHVIDATYTDLSAPKTTVSIFIDTSIVLEPLITYPANGDSLYNNMPLIKGVGQAGEIVNIFLDGAVIGFATADGSNRWTFKSGLIPNGVHTLAINGLPGLTFTVDNNVAYPLITYIGSELDGFILINNLPLIRGVSQPNATVTLWLSYIAYAPLGTTVADANGNWSYQVVPVNYIDPLSGLPVILAPIINGLSIISTSLVNHTVGINVTGYKLNRPPFSSITGVIDNTVFNTAYSPKRMLLNHGPILSSMLMQQTQESIYFQTADKNGNLRTVLAGETIGESDDVPFFNLRPPIALLEYASIRTKTNKTFSKILYDFNNGGVVKTNFRGVDIYMLPIGSMKMNNITDEVQEWKLLMSPNITYQSLLNIYKNGLTITLMQDSIYHSDYNSLHLVTYNFIKAGKYNYKELYDDWFEERNSAWVDNPEYMQKYQRTELIRDQIITKGISGINLKMYRCSDISLIATIPYVPVSPIPIPAPEVVMEAIIDFSLYPEDVYFFVMSASAYNTTAITVPTQGLVGGGLFNFTLGGTIVAGDIVTVKLNINSSSWSPLVFTVTALAGWSQATLLTAIRAAINADARFVASSITNGVSVAPVSPIIIYDAVVSVTGTAAPVDIAITERVKTKDVWDKTILIESRNSINMTGCFFSTGFSSVIRVEGLVKKIQPNLTAAVATEESGNTELIYSVMAKKRTIRFGTAYGLPDYLYLKIAAALALDELLVEGVGYTLEDNEKIQPSDDVEGHPLYYYNVDLNLKDNSRGKVFPVGAGVLLPQEEGVVLVVDATAFGLPAGSLINIEIDNE